MDKDSHTRRFFTSDLSGDRDEILLDAAEAHHALHVLRMRPGDGVELFNGNGTVARGILRSAGHRDVLVGIESRSACPPPAPPAIHLAFAAAKGKRLDWLIEKATELGASSLQQVIFDRSPPASRRTSEAKRRKVLAHCVSAAKQCGLNFLPELRDSEALEGILARPDDSLRILGDASPGAAGLAEALADTPCQRPVLLLVGPEGGLTDTERSDALDAGFAPVRIAETTLRVETAAIALLAAVTAFLKIRD